MIVEILNESVKGEEVLMRVSVGKVATLGHEDVVTVIDFEHFIELG